MYRRCGVVRLYIDVDEDVVRLSVEFGLGRRWLPRSAQYLLGCHWVVPGRATEGLVVGKTSNDACRLGESASR